MTSTGAAGETTVPTDDIAGLQSAALTLLRQADLLTPAALRATATLRIVDRVAQGAGTVTELARVTATQERPLRKLLDHLVALDVLTTDGARYDVTAVGRLLGSDMDHLGVRPMLDTEHVVGRTELAVLDLLHTLRTGGPAFESRGHSLWDDIDRSGSPDDVAPFARDAPGFDAGLVVTAFDWQSATSFVDVGGNTGALGAALLEAHPHLTGTIVDLPCFATTAQELVAARGLSDRCEVVGQSFFERLPEGRDVYLLSAILADWNDADATRILQRCREVLPAGGTVLVAEVHLRPDHPEARERTAAALRVEASMGNPDRTTADLAELAADAGLQVAWEGPASAVRSLVALRATGPTR